jgi:Vacuolar protein sorting-associated protein 62
MTAEAQPPVPAASPVEEDTDRRANPLEMVELLLVLVGAAAYVYVIGWAISWVRLAAGRLPVDASLPMIDNKVLFVAGLRLVVVMAIVFAAMCVVAWAVHAWTWEHQAREWHSVIRLGRPEAAKQGPRAADPNAPGPGGGAPGGRPGSALRRALTLRSRPPEDLDEAPVGDPFVRVIAGFNVGVLAATFGLAAARVLKTPIDQEWPPGPWWDLLAPWALISTILALFFAWMGPLWGNRLAHVALWVVAIAVALVSSAPIGVLLLTWAGIASVGRLYGRVRSKQGRPAVAAGHPRHLSFVLSPLPWLLLTIYALVGMAYYALPPVSFSQAIVTTPTGVQTGGYLAQTTTGVYLVTCTPLADATSTNELVSVIPSPDVRALTTGTTPFVVDSGLRSSLPTLALHAFGIDASTPSWIRPEVRSVRPTCAGDPLPRPSVGYPAPQLGAGVTAGPAPPGGRASDGEPPIEQTSPGIAALARRFQPTVLVTVADPFWPASVGAVLADLGSNGEPTCLEHLPAMSCPPTKPRPAPTLSELGSPGSSPDDFLEYPASPPLDPDPSGQLAAFLRGQQGHPVPVPTLRQRLADPGLVDPWASAQVYFYYAENTNPATWPAPNPAIKGKLIALQYWFFYPYNYYPTVVDADLMNDVPVAGDQVNTDLHQGDWEHVTVLLDARTRKPLWLYTARHSNEGQYYAWNSPLLSFDDGHPIVQAALGGHPTYDAHCRQSLRFATALPEGIRGRVADWIVCGSGRFAFRAATTPLVDIAKAPWACWRGHFGVATRSERGAAKLNEGSIQRTIDANYDVAGPRSPLWQAENGGLAADKTPKPGAPAPTDTGVCANGHSPTAPEDAAIRRGL